MPDLYLTSGAPSRQAGATPGQHVPPRLGTGRCERSSAPPSMAVDEHVDVGVDVDGHMGVGMDVDVDADADADARADADAVHSRA